MPGPLAYNVSSYQSGQVASVSFALGWFSWARASPALQLTKVSESMRKTADQQHIEQSKVAKPREISTHGKVECNKE